MGESCPGTSSKSSDEQKQGEPRDVQKKLRCLHTNIDGLNKVKGDELCIIIGQKRPHIVFLTETKMQVNQSIHQFIECPNYHFSNKDRRTGRGGVLILVRNDLLAQEYADKSWEDIEAVSFKLKLGSHQMKLICIYRPPSADCIYNAKLRETIRKFCSHQNDQMVICGDFNFPQID